MAGRGTRNVVYKTNGLNPSMIQPGTKAQTSGKNYSPKAARAGKDVGKKGKNFSKIAAKAGKKYGSKAAGQRVAGAVFSNLRSGHQFKK